MTLKQNMHKERLAREGIGMDTVLCYWWMHFLTNSKRTGRRGMVICSSTWPLYGIVSICVHLFLAGILHRSMPGRGGGGGKRGTS